MHKVLLINVFVVESYLRVISNIASHLLGERYRLVLTRSIKRDLVQWFLFNAITFSLRLRPLNRLFVARGKLYFITTISFTREAAEIQMCKQKISSFAGSLLKCNSIYANHFPFSDNIDSRTFLPRIVIIYPGWPGLSDKFQVDKRSLVFSFLQ